MSRIIAITAYTLKLMRQLVKEILLHSISQAKILTNNAKHQTCVIYSHHRNECSSRIAIRICTAQLASVSWKYNSSVKKYCTNRNYTVKNYDSAQCKVTYSIEMQHNNVHKEYHNTANKSNTKWKITQNHILRLHVCTLAGELRLI
jgi:hypothetical protein